MYTLLHIHTDIKFLNDSLRYIDTSINNTILFIGQTSDALIEKLENTKINYLITEKSTPISFFLNTIQTFDAVVLNDFCNIKQQIVLQAPTSTVFFVRLFGYELYGKTVNKYLDSFTFKSCFPISLKNDGVKKFIKKYVKRALQIEFNFDKKYQKELYQKINAVILVSKEEYQHLNKQFYLPNLIQLSLAFSENNSNIQPKDSTIIFGNSRHYWNNHLEILNLLKNTNPKLFLFFSYGPQNNYTNKVEQQVKLFSQSIIQNEFIDINKFNQIYATASAIVINSYRQHALGNIITAIFSGCKIYLNPKSSTFTWLKNNGFLISSVYDLKKDISSNRYSLSQDQQQYNINQYLKLKSTYTPQNFINSIISHINESATR